MEQGIQREKGQNPESYWKPIPNFGMVSFMMQNRALYYTEEVQISEFLVITKKVLLLLFHVTLI